MTITFTHKGEKISGKVISSEAVNIAIVFPEKNLGELGWSHCFQRKKNEWTSETFLKEKYPATYLDMLSQLNSL